MGQYLPNEVACGPFVVRYTYGGLGHVGGMGDKAVLFELE